MRNVLPQPAILPSPRRQPWANDAIPAQPFPDSITLVPAPPALARAAGPEGSASLASLRQLAQFRTVAIAAQLLAIGLAYGADLALPYAVLLCMVGLIAAVNLVLRHRLREAGPATHAEVFWQLFVDLAALTLVLGLSGGARNPFIVLYFLHVVLMALLLPARMVAAGTLVAIALSLLAAQLAMPLRLRSGAEVPVSMLVAARWLSFALAAAMIAWFIARIRVTLERQQNLLEEAARKAHNEEAVMRIATVAAGAAHELASPLMSMSVVVGEWQRQGSVQDFRRDVGILASQIDACKEALSNLRAAARAARWDGPTAQPIDDLMNELVGRCRAMRPGVNLKSDLSGPAPAPTIAADPALKQAILVLLNNAADASPEHVHIATAWDRNAVEMTVSDRGQGIPPERLGDLGKKFFSTKPAGEGNGLGVILTASTVERLGGSIRWSNRTGGGACAQLRLPLPGLQRHAIREEQK